MDIKKLSRICDSADSLKMKVEALSPWIDCNDKGSIVEVLHDLDDESYEDTDKKIKELMKKEGYKHSDTDNHHDTNILSFVKDSEETELERAKDFFHNDWEENGGVFNFNLTEDEAMALEDYVNEMFENIEDPRRFFIDKSDDKIEVTQMEE